jgi:hypothetical protein
MDRKSNTMHKLRVDETKIRIQAQDIPRRGPMARPSCPADLNCPRALPLASWGCSLVGLPVIGSTPPSSHCKDAKAVKEVTTVADVNARHTAAPCRSLSDIVGCVEMNCGSSVSRIRPPAQLETPRRAMTPSPILDVTRRTYPPCNRALMIPIDPINAPFCLLLQSNTVK